MTWPAPKPHCARRASAAAVAGHAACRRPADHPGTIDLTRVEPALKALFPKVTDDQLKVALRNIDVPGHDHFVGTLAKGKPQWWEVKVVVVDNADTYRTLQAKKSLPFLQSLLNRHDKHVIGVVPTNLFLYFSVQ